MALNMSLNTTSLTSNSSISEATGSTAFGLVVELLCVWTLLGNLVIILVLSLYKPLSIPDILVFSLALSDLLNAIYPAQVLNMIPNLLKTTWTEGLCVSFTVSAYWLRISSVLTVTVISIDRLIAVQKPLVYRSRVMHEVNSAKILISVLWAVSCLLASLPFVGFGHSGFHNKHCHYQLLDLGLPYGILMEIIGLLQLAIVLYCYIAIKISTGNFMKRQDEFRHAQLARTVSSTPSIEQDGVDSIARQGYRKSLSVENHSQLRRMRSWTWRAQGSKRDLELTDGMKQVAKMEKLMATLVFLFYLSWLPFLVSNFISLITGERNETVVKLVGMFSLINGLINPVLYATIYPRYRKGYVFVFKTISSFCGGKKPDITADDFDLSKRNKSKRLQTLREVTEYSNITTKSMRGLSHASHTSLPPIKAVAEEEQADGYNDNQKGRVLDKSPQKKADFRAMSHANSAAEIANTGTSPSELNPDFSTLNPEVASYIDSVPDATFISVSPALNDDNALSDKQENDMTAVPEMVSIARKYSTSKRHDIFLGIGEESKGLKEL